MLLSYRLRSPGARGFETRLARSADGIAFADVWRASRDDFDAESIERSAVVPAAGAVRLYVSYVARADRRWRIALLEAPRAEALDPAARLDVLDAAATGGAGVKDPVVLFRAGRWWMLASASEPIAADPALDARGDAFSSGLVRSLTGLAASRDGRRWTWQGIVLSPPAGGWDAFEARIASVWRDAGVHRAFYDGAAELAGNYEERTGLAESRDLRTWRRLTTAGPLLVAPAGSGGLRYVSRLDWRGRTHHYFEGARADGAHELRVAVP